MGGEESLDEGSFADARGAGDDDGAAVLRGWMDGVSLVEFIVSGVDSAYRPFQLTVGAKIESYCGCSVPRVYAGIANITNR